jgi:molecular chaperone GrpE
VSPDDELAITDGEVVEEQVDVPSGASAADPADDLLEDLVDRDQLEDLDSVFGTTAQDAPAGAPVVELTDLDESELRQVLTELLGEHNQLVQQRDENLDTAQRVQAEYANFRRRTETQRADLVARAAERLVGELLPVLDACEAALGHGADDVEPIYAALLTTLTKLGLAIVSDAEVPFDPNIHEAVMSEPGNDSDDGHVVAAIMRTGYVWNGNVIRPAMVKVRG